MTMDWVTSIQKSFIIRLFPPSPLLVHNRFRDRRKIDATHMCVYARNITIRYYVVQHRNNVLHWQRTTATWQLHKKGQYHSYYRWKNVYFSSSLIEIHMYLCRVLTCGQMPRADWSGDRIHTHKMDRHHIKVGFILCALDYADTIQHIVFIPKYDRFDFYFLFISAPTIRIHIMDLLFCAPKMGRGPGPIWRWTGEQGRPNESAY